MAKKGVARERITLVCTECKKVNNKTRENYRTEKNKRNTPDRLEIKKYCPVCNKRTIHREGK